MPDALAPVAKAIAGFLAPIVVALVAIALDRIGVDVPIDPGVVETLIVSVISAVAVWATRNRTPPAA